MPIWEISGGLRILPTCSEVMFIRLVRLLNLISMPHWPKEGSIGHHLDLVRIPPGYPLMPSRVSLKYPN